MKRPLLAHLTCLNAQDLNCTLMFGKIQFRLSQILATSCVVRIKLFPSAAPIHPHHTISAERCQIAGLKRHNWKKKASTLIRTNVQQEKKQGKAEFSLVGTLHQGRRQEGRVGWLQSCLRTLMLTRWISDMFILPLGAQLLHFKWWSDGESSRNTHLGQKNAITL